MKRKNKLTFFVSVEGEVSEIEYLKRLKLLINNEKNFTYNVDFVMKPKKPISFLKVYGNGYYEFPYYHIVDMESNSSADRTKFKNIINDILKARKKFDVQYNLAYTNYCFELWLILHKKAFTAPKNNKFNYKDEIVSLYNLNTKKVSCWENLKEEKTVKDIMKQINLDDVYRAIDNAKQIQSFNLRNHKAKKIDDITYYENNPSLSLHEFVEYIITKCK